MVYANPRKEYGYAAMSVAPDILKLLDKIKKEQFCRTRSEALRRMAHFWLVNAGPTKKEQRIAEYEREQSRKNAANGIYRRIFINPLTDLYNFDKLSAET